MSGLPILVEGTALRALVVGGGAVAARKAETLANAGASVRVVAPELGAAMRALVESGRVVHTERSYREGDVGDATLVVAATDDRSVNATVADEARSAHRLVNVADAPATGSFATMAAHRAGGLVIGVSAGGVPGAAARIRDAIAQRFDERYARAVGDLASLRNAMIERRDGERWRTLSASVIGPGFCELVERERLDEEVASWR